MRDTKFVNWDELSFEGKLHYYTGEEKKPIRDAMQAFRDEWELSKKVVLLISDKPPADGDDWFTKITIGPTPLDIYISISQSTPIEVWEEMAQANND